ncbi:reverse transcriptase domain-containing protein [Tanacetum coccineum]
MGSTILRNTIMDVGIIVRRHITLGARPSSGRGKDIKVKPVLTSKDAQEETRRCKRCHNTPSPEHQMLEESTEEDEGQNLQSTDREEKEEESREFSIGWEIKERVCSHTQKVVTRVTARKERNPFPESVTMKELVQEGQKCSPKVKIAEGTLKFEIKKAKAMPTWCRMFNSTLNGSARVWFDDLPPESIDNYDDLKNAFLANFLQQKKCIKDPVEIHHIKQSEGESTEDFVQRFKAESRHVNRAPECMRISGFMHGITNPELIKRLNDNIPPSERS